MLKLGTCNGITSACYWFDYALESKCHVGYECMYSSKAKSLQETKVEAELSSIKYHSIEWVIRNYLENAESVPECKVSIDCMEKECSSWTWAD